MESAPWPDRYVAVSVKFPSAIDREERDGAVGRVHDIQVLAGRIDLQVDGPRIRGASASDMTGNYRCAQGCQYASLRIDGERRHGAIAKIGCIEIGTGWIDRDSLCLRTGGKRRTCQRGELARRVVGEPRDVPVSLPV